MAIFRREHPLPLTGASNAGAVGRNRDSEPISGFTVCCEPFQQQVQSLSCDRQGRVYSTIAGKQPSLLMAGNNDEVYDLLLLVGLWSHINEPERLEVNLRQLIEPIVT